MDAKRWVPNAMMAVIQRWKDRGLYARTSIGTADEDSDFADGRAQRTCIKPPIRIGMKTC